MYLYIYMLYMYRPARHLRLSAGLSAMIRGAEDGELFVVKDYSEDDVENVLEEFFNNLKRTWRTAEP